MTEYSTRPGARRYPFPEEWGAPPIEADARAAWILSNIERGRAARARGEEVRWLHVPRPDEVQLWLIAHVESPAIEAARREALLSVSRATGRLLDLEARREPEEVLGLVAGRGVPSLRLRAAGGPRPGATSKEDEWPSTSRTRCRWGTTASSSVWRRRRAASVSD